MGEPSRVQMLRALSALSPFVPAYHLPVNPEEMEEIAYAILKHAGDTDLPAADAYPEAFDDSLDDIAAAVKVQIAETQAAHDRMMAAMVKATESRQIANSPQLTPSRATPSQPTPSQPTPSEATPTGPVSELRLAVTVADLDAALAFYRDTLGLPEIESYQDGAARVVVLAAGRATLELFNEEQAQLIDDVEVGRRVAPPIRVALEVADSAALSATLVDAGATLIAEPVVTPWRHRNARLDAPGDLQLTLFTVLDD